MVSALDFRSEVGLFDAQSLPLCCFLKDKKLYPALSLPTQV